MESIQKSTAGSLSSFSLSFKTEGKEGLWRDSATAGQHRNTLGVPLSLI